MTRFPGCSNIARLCDGLIGYIIMLELNALFGQISDMQGRLKALRGYL